MPSVYSRVNQKLKPISEEEKSHCFDQRTVNCTTEAVPEEVTKQERRERKVPDSRRKCRMVQKKADGSYPGQKHNHNCLNESATLAMIESH